MSVFEAAMMHIFKWEGGYSHNPNDRGGETNFGISKRHHPDVDIKNLTKAEASNIYKEEYWVPSGCELLQRRPEFALLHFDTAVNCGVSRAVSWLQTTFHVPLVDGKFGDQTWNYVDALMSSGLDLRGIYAEYVLLRIRHYMNLANGDPTQIGFLRGWMNRMLDTTERLL